MSGKTASTVDHIEAQAELVADIKKNVASLKLSIDRILEDMNGIRSARLEILDRFDTMKNENTENRAQIQMTLGRAKRAIRKSEENRKRLEIVLKKISNMSLAHTFTNTTDSHLADSINGNVPSSFFRTVEKTKGSLKKKTITNMNVNEEKIRLELLDNRTRSDADRDDPDKSDVKWGRDSALKELQWVLKLKLYKLRHHYRRLEYDPEFEERVPLPVAWKHA